MFPARETIETGERKEQFLLFICSRDCNQSQFLLNDIIEQLDLLSYLRVNSRYVSL